VPNKAKSLNTKRVSLYRPIL